MHTTEYQSVRFHHNSDLSGDVVIVSRDGGESATISGEDLVRFVLDKVIIPRDLEEMENQLREKYKV